MEIVKNTGCSIATVSRALNEETSVMVKASTREKICRVAARLNYVPDRMARSLRMKRSNTLGFLMNFETDILSGYIQEIMGGVVDGLKGTGYDLKIISAAHHDSIDRVLRTHGLDGIILPHGYGGAFPHLAEESRRHKNVAWPVVVINDYHPEYLLNQLYSDNLLAAKFLGEYLIDRGYKKFCFMGSDKDSPDSGARKKGFLKALESRDIKFNDPGYILNGHFQEKGGYIAASTFLKERPDFRGVLFCANDAMALGAMRAVGESPIRCPEEIGIAGFDGITAGEFSNPALTTVKFELYDMGRISVDILTSIISGKQKHFVKQKYPFSLIERRSCK